jgi:EAL and modified HD-GYP domain-containing signal transduction protein
MDLLIVPVPLFDQDITVEAYYFRHQKGNDILDVARRGVGGELDGAMISPPLEMLNTIGIEAFTMGKPIFIPISPFMALTRLELQTQQPPDKIIFLLDESVKPEEAYLENIKRLKALGFRFGIQRIEKAADYDAILKLCDFIMFDFRILGLPEQVELYRDVQANYSHLKLIFSHIASMDLFNQVKTKFNGWFEGRFFRVPVTKGEHKVKPLQANQINLLNVVRDDDFDFDSVSKIIERDTAITIDLMRMVNSPYVGLRNKVKTINHAVTMLGQKEVRKWITTAVSRLLSSDKPSEISRLSLVRAKFCESLAPMFGMRQDTGSLFLMGLFSVLDEIMDMPMEQALELVHVSDAIYEALVDKKGEYYPIYNFILEYENANWKTVSRMMILHDIPIDAVFNAYVDALCWYRDLIAEQ